MTNKIERTVYAIVVVALAVMITMLWCIGLVFNPMLTVIGITISDVGFGIGLGVQIHEWIIEDVRKELE